MVGLQHHFTTPLHPLDLTAEPPQDNSAQFRTGLIQTAHTQLSNPNSTADIVLGVPFMRNVYTVNNGCQAWIDSYQAVVRWISFLSDKFHVPGGFAYTTVI